MSELKKLRLLEEQNGRLTGVVADLTLGAGELRGQRGSVASAGDDEAGIVVLPIEGEGRLGADPADSGNCALPAPVRVSASGVIRSAISLQRAVGESFGEPSLTWNGAASAVPAAAPGPWQGRRASPLPGKCAETEASCDRRASNTHPGDDIHPS